MATPRTAHHPLDLLNGVSQWASDNWFDLLIAVAAGVAIYSALGLVKSLGQKLLRRGAGAAPAMGVFADALSRTMHVFMMLVAARLVVGFAEPPPALIRIIGFLFTVVIVFQVAIWLRAVAIGLIQLRADPAAGGNETLANASGLIRVLVSVVIFAIATVVVLDNLGVNVTALVAGLGIGGIAIGLAAQGIFSDLFASLSILFDKPFRIGEAINFGAQTGTVERIGLKTTRLRAATGERLVVSNAQLLSKDIVNYTGLHSRRILFAIGIIYQTSPQVAAAIPDMLREIVNAQGGTFVRSGFVKFGASSLDFELEFDVIPGEWDKVYAIRHGVGIAILEAFNARGIEFAYPTQTSFTAAPDGRMILPYPGREDAGA